MGFFYDDLDQNQLEQRAFKAFTGTIAYNKYYKIKNFRYTFDYLEKIFGKELIERLWNDKFGKCNLE